MNAPRLFPALLLSLAALAGAAALPTSGTEGEVVGGKEVNLRGRLPLSKVLADLAGQTGVRVEDRRGEGDPTLTLDVRGASFWEALEAVADAAGAVVDVNPRDGRLALVRRPEGYRPPPTSRAGPFRLCVRRTACARDLDSERGSTTLTLEAAWPPELLPLYLETQPQGLRVLDDSGKPIPVPAEGSVLAPVDGRSSFTFDLVLPAVPRSSARLGLVEGRLTAVAPSKMLTFTFDTLDQLEKAEAPRQRQEEGVTCRIDRVTLARDRWTVRVSLDLPASTRKLESFQSWVVHNELALFSADGKRRRTTSSYVLENASSRRAVLSYHFTDRPGQPLGRPGDWKLRYRTPARIVEIPVPFAFKEVPLP